LIELFGDKKIMLGSDYPFPLGEAVPGKMIESMKEVSEATRQRMLCENALEWLGPGAARLKKELGQ
jgi:aminocarboxymuconate-semialdehyde decarboxylase